MPMTEANTAFSTKDQIYHWQQPLPIIFFEVACLFCFNVQENIHHMPESGYL